MSAALIAKLIEAGTPAELVGEVAMALAHAQAASDALESRRRHERERKAKSRDVTGQNVTERDSAEIADKGSLEVSPHTPLPKPSKQSPLNPPKSKKVDEPDWLPEAPWAAFREMRQKMRGIPFTETAQRTVIGKLESLRSQGHDPAKLLMKAVERGHRTVFEDETTKATGAVQLSHAEQVANLKKSIEFYSRNGRHDEVRECRQRIAALEGGTVGLAKQAARGLRA